jgi:hypothetical protein
MPQSVELIWKGRAYRIAEDEAFAAGEALEDVVTLIELATWGRNMKFRKLARAYAALLNFAGAEVTPQEVHAEFMASVRTAQKGGPEVFAVRAAATLMAILMDGAPPAPAGGAGNPLEAGSS